MTWPEFVVAFVLMTLGALFFARRLFAGHWIHLTQVTTSVTCLTFLIDYPAEQRRFWTFTLTTGVTLLDTPLENHLFVAACAVNIMIVYRSLQRCLRGSSREGGPIPRP